MALPRGSHEGKHTHSVCRCNFIELVRGPIIYTCEIEPSTPVGLWSTQTLVWTATLPRQLLQALLIQET